MTRWMLTALLLGACSVPAAELPIAGLAHAAFYVSDLDKATAFYTGVLGYEKAFDFKDPQGRIRMAFLKVNDHQYIELFPSLKPDQEDRLAHVAIETTDMERLRSMLLERGVEAGKINDAKDGNRTMWITDPDGRRIEFVQYMPGSLHWNARGRFNNARRISAHLLHAGVRVEDERRAMAFYRDKLGFVEIWRGGPTDGETRWINMRMPGPRGDYIELMLDKTPPTRARLGSMHHICLQVDEIQAPYKVLLSRGVEAGERHAPRIGRNRRWLLNLFDPDGSRTELMESKTVD